MDAVWLLATATGDARPPQVAGILLLRGRPVLAAVLFGYADGSSDTVVSFVEDAVAGVISINFFDRDGGRNSRCFLTVDGNGFLLRLVAVLDTAHPATRHVFVVMPAPRPGAAALPPAPFVPHDLPPINVPPLEHLIDMPGANDPNGQLMVAIAEAITLLFNRQGAALELNPDQWIQMHTLLISLHASFPEAYKIAMEDLLAEIRLQRVRESKKLMLKSFFWNVAVSFISHMALYFLSCHFDETSKHFELATPPMAVSYPPLPPRAFQSSLLWSWAIEKLISPFVLVILVWLVKAFVIDKEIQLLVYSHNTSINFLVNSLSKILFFSVKEFPLITNTSLVAHLLSFAVDCIGAIWLLMKQGCWDQDIADS